MKEQTFNKSVDAPMPTVQPNFDDAQALLSARRVVPLAKIDATERQRRRWLLGGAFALAMVLGAASALLASYLKLRDVPSVTTEIFEGETPVANASESIAKELPRVETTEAAENADASETPVSTANAPVVRKRPAASGNTDSVRSRVVREMDEKDEPGRTREAVLIDAWQERRARRAARRERRNNRVNHDDRDLSNLDEIFEGPRRP